MLTQRKRRLTWATRWRASPAACCAHQPSERNSPPLWTETAASAAVTLARAFIGSPLRAPANRRPGPEAARCPLAQRPPPPRSGLAALLLRASQNCWPGCCAQRSARRWMAVWPAVPRHAALWPGLPCREGPAAPLRERPQKPVGLLGEKVPGLGCKGCAFQVPPGWAGARVLERFLPPARRGRAERRCSSGGRLVPFFPQPCPPVA